jgi:para-nitrobenzyl esterase
MKSHVIRSLGAITVAGALVLGVAQFSDVVASAGSPPQDQRGRLVVQTESGKLRGVTDQGAEEFLGIPYAAPPVRDLRFAPPAAPARWTGVRDADRQAPACLQFQPSGVREEQAVSEDCLYLDVYRPRHTSPRDKLPVMVWFHGGGNTQGTGVIYGGQTMADKTNTVIVTINYRLGALGFLAHPALSAETRGGSGNYATMDQIQSLKWVRDNIRGFGGNPGNVTIYGQSAGGQAVCTMLTSPAAKGLFAKAIVQSMGCTTTRITLAAGEASGVTYAQAVGCTDAATVTTCLRKAWPGTLIANQANYRGGQKVGGSILPLQFNDALAQDAWNKVPVMTGSMKSENRLLSTALAGITAQGYVDRVRSTYGDRADQVLSLYPLSDFKSPYDAITQVQTDAGFACGVERNARALTTRVPTYRYEFNDPTSPTLYGFRIPGEDMSNGHSAELAYLFDFTLGEGPLTASQRKLSDQMMRYWATFARTGDPSYRGAPTWPTYGEQQRVMQLRSGANSAVIRTFDQAHHCGFWLA